MELATTAGKIALRASLGQAVKHFREKRFERLISGLENGDIKLGDRELESDQFIACFLKTNEAIEKSAAQAKVDFLIKLFVSGIKENIIVEKPDYYSELVTIFSELSYREIEVLYLIGDTLPYDGESRDNSKVGEQNETAAKLLALKYNVSEEYAFAMISRLQRTGLVIGSNVLGRWPYVRLTQLYKDIRSFLHFQALGN
ncbi:hypothetical protein [Pseudoalteromonas viridis]|uniref:Uncharacterized protein n=1 Tax=Pseudoalteromonas viridis TaxID=339617 RepID=A0ABX7UZE5_9GAMM|nr:hypothetical protein [Pseudoalteromonas viridis]QTL34003.1 hypothetical protein J5X90_10470 [Pseudoalteromonas viridis]